MEFRDGTCDLFWRPPLFSEGNFLNRGFWREKAGGVRVGERASEATRAMSFVKAERQR